MREKKSFFKRITSTITLIIALYILLYVYGIYKTKNLNDFVKAEEYLYTSSFSRDFETSLGKEASYKIESTTYNDAMIYREMDVEPNTAYKVSCKVKTEEVIKKTRGTGAGAHISLEGTTERSSAVVGTQDWTELVLYFNSGNRESVKIGFRLGGYEDQCIGTAWFDDLKLEKGVVDTSNEWDFVCFIFKNTQVELDKKAYDISMNIDDINQMKSNMVRFKNTLEEFSRGKMQVNYEIIEIDKPITSLAYDTTNAYYVNPENVSEIINPYLEAKEYDHIFAAVKLGDLSKNIEIPVNDWIGLGGIEYHNIGFSNIRLSNNERSNMYKYIVGVNEFPDEVLVHEFLHALERNSKEFGYDRPNLHDYEQYGYENERTVGQKQWYIDYMNHEIQDAEGNTYGLDSKIYTTKPVHGSDFIYSLEIDLENEPKNIIEEIRDLCVDVIEFLKTLSEK